MGSCAEDSAYGAWCDGEKSHGEKAASGLGAKVSARVRSPLRTSCWRIQKSFSLEKAQHVS